MQDVITMRQIGRGGRWGNSVFQYMFLRTYSRRHNLKYQCDKWIGSILLGHDDPPITLNLPRVREKRNRDPRDRHRDELGLTFPPENCEPVGKDWVGYAQYHTSWYAPDKAFIRSLFVPRAELLERLTPAVNVLRSMGKTVIGLHMRRGDTGRFIFYLTPNCWYLDWLAKHWTDFDDPVLFIASEEPSDREAFSDYNPVMSSDLLELSGDPYPIYNYLRFELDNPTPVRMDFFPDWWCLSQCDVLVFGNSTFSFTAAMMNGRLQQAWRSKLSLQSFEQIDPWNEWPLVREDIRDYPGIADTWYDRNPQWSPEVRNRS